MQGICLNSRADGRGPSKPPKPTSASMIRLVGTSPAVSALYERLGNCLGQAKIQLNLASELLPGITGMTQPAPLPDGRIHPDLSRRQCVERTVGLRSGPVGARGQRAFRPWGLLGRCRGALQVGFWPVRLHCADVQAGCNVLRNPDPACPEEPQQPAPSGRCSVGYGRRRERPELLELVACWYPDSLVVSAHHHCSNACSASPWATVV